MWKGDSKKRAHYIKWLTRDFVIIMPESKYESVKSKMSMAQNS